MHLTNVLLGFTSFSAIPVIASPPAVSPSLQEILDNAYKPPLYTYPTSLTQGIVPKPIHSHNDYWRPVPVYTAVSAGCISIEADVWLINSTLLVGHELAALSSTRTLSSLYIDPLLSILKAQNPNTSFSTSPAHNGVFDTDSTQTLYLFIDVKTDGPTTWPAVVKALQPLREGGWLTSVGDKEAVTKGTITVVGTGNTPLSQIQGVSPRDYFYDGPLGLLSTTFSNLTSAVAPIASTDFAAVFGKVKGTGLNETQLAALRGQLERAHEKGIMARYWDQPGWPIMTRDAVWRTLLEEGVDFINADDVDAAAEL